MRRFSRQERGPADLVASAVAASFPHVAVVVLRLQSVSTFTTRRFQRAATPLLLLSLKKRRPRQPSLHRRIVMSQRTHFHLRLICLTYRPSDGVEPHRS